jgi:hypothetical protein
MYKQCFTYGRYFEDNYSMVGTYYSSLTQGWPEVLLNVVTDTLSTYSCTAGRLVTLLGGQVQKGPPYLSFLNLSHFKSTSIGVLDLLAASGCWGLTVGMQ